MDIQLEQNPFKTLIIGNENTIKVYVYFKTGVKTIYKFFYSADQGLGSLDVDLSKIDIKDTEKFIENESIPSLLDFTYIDGNPSTEKFRLEFMRSLTTKLSAKLKIEAEPEENIWKAKYETADEINKRLIETLKSNA